MLEKKAPNEFQNINIQKKSCLILSFQAHLAEVVAVLHVSNRMCRNVVHLDT